MLVEVTKKSTIEKIINEKSILVNRQTRKLRTDIDFELDENELIYYTESEIRRLCISVILKEEIFRLTHNENAHAEIHRCFNRLIETLFISRLSRKL